jgi:tetratricopeptide (TPR) repeat protein
MGAPFFRDYYEPADLSISLRRWWKEPELKPVESASQRVYLLREWLHSRGKSEWVGAKHPLLTLCVEDLVRAWGGATRVIWCRRSLDEAIHSLEKLKWWPNAAFVQQHLYTAAESSFLSHNGLLIDYHESLARPDEMLSKLTEFLSLQPTEEQLSEARQRLSLERQSHRASGRASPPDSVSASHDSGTASSRDPKDTDHKSQQAVVPDRIVGTLLCDNCRGVVGEAVKSVIDFVDILLVVDTGCTDGSIDLVAQIAGDKLQYRSFTWQDDFSEARNFALREARQLHAQWALTIDSDERLEFAAIGTIEELRRRLRSNPEAQGWMVESRSGGYQKERFIQPTANLQWRGRTHEALVGFAINARPKLTGVRFSELPKSHHAFHQKLERDLKILRQELNVDPGNGRAWFYLGQTLSGLNQPEGAIAAFDRCAAHSDWPEMVAWACYRAAKELVDSQRFEEAIERCGLGLSAEPRFPELGWMSAYCCLKLQRYPHAVAWAEMAAAIGAMAFPEGLDSRIGFRDLIGWYEGPFEVLCVAYGKLGQVAMLDRARRQLSQAHARRLKDFPDSGD